MACRKSSKQNELVAHLVTGKKAPCVFCNREVDDEIIYGKLYIIGDIQCHYFCVLLASCLIQKGKDEEGLFGFLYKDILAEVERSKKHKCSYCNRGGATLGCSVTQCRKQFHLPCGRERNAVSLFHGNYKSFCKNHAPKQKITSEIMSKVEARRRNASRKIKSLTDTVNKEIDAVLTCAICYEEVPASPRLDTFWPPCCARDAWFHRSCLQRMALSAGMHYLKCPLCNDKDNFHKAVLSQGYYIPDRDAAWELEQNAFAEIYERSLSCNAEECRCPMGRKHDTENGPWEIRSCLLCGSSGSHTQCLLNECDAAYVCSVCRPVAPDDLGTLVKTVEAVILGEENRTGERARDRPVMPSRMSLRRTKGSARLAPSSSSDHSQYNCNEDDVITSRRDLNLKTPKRPPTQLSSYESGGVGKNIDSKLFSPVKLLEQQFRETGLDFDLNEEILEDMRLRFKKPRPLSEKRKIVNDIISGVFNDILKEPKQKEAVKEWCSPKKTCELIEEVHEVTNVGPISQEKSGELVEIRGSDQEYKNSLNVDTSLELIDEHKEIGKSNNNQKGEFEESFKGNVGDSVDASNTFQSLPECITMESDHNLPISDTLINHKDSRVENDQVIVDTETVLIDGGDRKNDTNDLDKEVLNNSDESSSNSTFQLPPEFVAEEQSDDSLPVLNTPKKLKTVDIENDSSLEISENDNQMVNIDVVKMKINCNDTENGKAKSPFKIKKCALKFNPLDKESLKDHNIGMDMECFKNYYLNEVDKAPKCSNTRNNDSNIIDNDSDDNNNDDNIIKNDNNVNNSDDNIIKSDNSIIDNNVERNTVKEKKKGVKRTKRVKEVNCKKRKTDSKEVVVEKVPRYRKKRNTEIDKLKLTFKSDRRRKKTNRRKEKKIKIKLSISDVNIPVQIKWRRRQQLKLKISEIKNNKKTKNKLMGGNNKSTLKQYILNPKQCSTNEIIVKPEKEVTPPKRKYIKHEKFSDNLVQTSLTKFFSTKTPEKYHHVT